eukprot:505462-Pyramimonas_sp.AAC.1
MLVSDVCQARATHGVQDGCWYFELTIEHLGETGHARCGWCTSKADIQVSFLSFIHAERSYT